MRVLADAVLWAHPNPLTLPSVGIKLMPLPKDADLRRCWLAATG